MKQIKLVANRVQAYIFAVALVFLTLSAGAAHAGQALVTKFEKTVSRVCDKLTYSIKVAVESNGLTADSFTLSDPAVNGLIKLNTAAEVTVSTSAGLSPAVSVSSGYLTVKFATPVTGSKVASTLDINFTQKIDPSLIGGSDLLFVNQAMLKNDKLSEPQVSKDPAIPGSPETPKGSFVKAEHPTSISVPQAELKKCLSDNQEASQISCLSADAKVTCGEKPGTYVITLATTGAGGLAPDHVSITPTTPGVTIVGPQSSYAAIGGVVKITVAGANPGDVLTFDVEGTKTGAGAVEGSDLCCNGTVKVTIPKDLPCEKSTVDVTKICDPAVYRKYALGPAIDALGWVSMCHIKVTTTGPQNGTLTVNDSLTGGGTIVSANSTTFAGMDLRWLRLFSQRTAPQPDFLRLQHRHAGCLPVHG